MDKYYICTVSRIILILLLREPDTAAQGSTAQDIIRHIIRHTFHIIDFTLIIYSALQTPCQQSQYI